MSFKMRPRILFIFSCLVCVLAENDQSGWVDPHDMSPVYDKEFFPYEDIELSPTIQPETSGNCLQTESRSQAYLKRTINMILNSVHEDAIDENKYKGHLIFEIDMEKFVRLHEFTSNKFDDLHEVDVILEEILKRPPNAYMKEYFLGWCLKAFKMISSRAGIISILILTYLFVVYKLMKGNFNYWYIFKFLFINFFIMDFIFEWIRLYKKAEIDKFANTVKFENAPDYCNPKKMSTMQVFLSVLSTVDNCKEYYHVTLMDIFWTVSPSDVLTEIVTKFITVPLKQIGPAIGQFVYGIYSALPFGVSIILLPMVLFFVMCMTCILTSFILNVPVKFNIFHLVSFSFGDDVQQIHGNVLTGRTVEQLIDIVKEKNTPRSISEEPKLPISLTEKVPDKSKTSQNGKIKKKSIEYNVEKEEKIDAIPVKEDCETVTEDVKKCGYEPDIVESDLENNTKEDGIRKRKREDGSGDM